MDTFLWEPTCYLAVWVVRKVSQGLEVWFIYDVRCITCGPSHIPYTCSHSLSVIVVDEHFFASSIIISTTPDLPVQIWMKVSLGGSLWTLWLCWPWTLIMLAEYTLKPLMEYFQIHHPCFQSVPKSDLGVVILTWFPRPHLSFWLFYLSSTSQLLSTIDGNLFNLVSHVAWTTTPNIQRTLVLLSQCTEFET